MIKLQPYFDTTITVSQKTEEIPDPDPGDKPTGETTKDFELTDGMSGKEITVANEGDVVSATFTPPADGYYRVDIRDIRDISDYEAYVSTSLYRDDNEDNITTTSSDALTWKLEKGKKYTYQFELQEEETDDYIRGSFKVSFRKVEIKTIKNIELVLKDEYQESDCTMLDDLGDFYNTKITYQDGLSKIYERLGGTDEFGNQWDTTDKEDESTSYTSKAIKHRYPSGIVEQERVTGMISASSRLIFRHWLLLTSLQLIKRQCHLKMKQTGNITDLLHQKQEPTGLTVR